MPLLWHCFDITLASLRNYFGITLALCWHYFELHSIQFNSTKLNSIELNSNKLTLIQLKLILLNSINSIQLKLNSTQPHPNPNLGWRTKLYLREISVHIQMHQQVQSTK